MTRRIAVELHARAAELAGARELVLELSESATVADVKRALGARLPALGGLVDACAVATDRDYLAEAAVVGDASRLHLVPPVSGG